jgi:hypothetical protein
LISGRLAPNDPAADGYPRCSDIWIAGEVLPAKYEGCDAGSTIEVPATFGCSDGSEFTTFRDRYWAVLGGKIKDSGSSGGITADAEYAADDDACLLGESP